MYQPQPPAPKGKGLSIASMVLGILGCIPYAGWACAIVGLILGLVSKKQLKEQGAPHGMATAGIICSIIGLAVSVLITTCIVCIACRALNEIPWEYYSY
ncbi:MAG: DUF4190 domain-containing protein [Clostridiales bacterium]|nr:DUF4190 domain-containing protein [Clostridiales bacterium]